MEITIAAQFKEFRTRRLKVSQRALAHKIGITANYISMVERGRRPVSSALMLAIAQACGLAFTFKIE